MDGIDKSESRRLERISLYQGAQFRAPSPNSIRGAGRFHFGCYWSGHFPRASQLVIHNVGTLNVDGEFYLFDDAFVSLHGRLTVGSGYINSGAKIFVFDQLTIGNRVAIAENVTIRDSDNHRIADRPKMTDKIIIDDDVWIGMNVTILKGVHIGKGAAIGAGAVVNRNVPPGMLAVGVPARVVREISHS